MKKFAFIVLCLLTAGAVIGASSNSSKGKPKKKPVKKTTTVIDPATYNGPLLKIQDPKAADPIHAGFVVNGHYQFTVVETVTPVIHFSGAEQPVVHICVEGTKNQPNACIGELHNGYGNMVWDANATTKSYIVAYKPDGTPLRLKKDLGKDKPANWKGNEITWEDGEYTVKISIAKCKVEPNRFCICPR